MEDNAVFCQNCGFSTAQQPEQYSFPVDDEPKHIQSARWRFSQLITSFIASESLGIHHTPFIIYFNFILLAYSEIIHVVRLYMISIFAHCCGIYFSIFPVCQRTVTLTSTDRLKGIEPFPCSENLCFLPPGCQLMVKVEGFASKCR